MKVSIAIVSALAIAVTASAVRADATLVSDGFNRTGALNGSSPDVGSGTWSTYSSGYSGGDANGGANYTSPITPATDGANANFSGTTYHENTAGFISFTPAASGLLTATAVLSSESGASNSWAFVAFATGSATTPDVYNSGSVVGWVLLKYPAYNSGNYGAELFGNSGTGHASASGQVNYSGAGSSEDTLVLTDDPATGIITATVDGNPLGTVTQTGTVTGIVIGNRAGSASTVSAPGVASFDSIVVSQATPEPASLGLLAIGAAGLIARRRR